MNLNFQLENILLTILLSAMVLKLLFAAFILAVFFEVNCRHNLLHCDQCDRYICPKPIIYIGRWYTFLLILSIKGQNSGVM